jgi:hypothetical protein
VARNNCGRSGKHSWWLINRFAKHCRFLRGRLDQFQSVYPRGALPFRRLRKCWLYFRFFAQHIVCLNPYTAVFVARSGLSIGRAPECISTLGPETAEACPGGRCWCGMTTAWAMETDWNVFGTLCYYSVRLETCSIYGNPMFVTSSWICMSTFWFVCHRGWLTLRCEWF